MAVVGQFVNAEPLYPLEYTAAPNNLETGHTDLKCTWTFVGVNNTGSLIYDNRTTTPPMEKWKVRGLKWNNTPNTSFKSIKVRLDYKVGGVAKSVTSPEMQVTVKHIGPVISMNVGGTTYSNNQTRSQSCGATNLTVSVPAVYTDPAAALTYTWTYPSGWTGPATSSSSDVTVTTTPGTGSGGVIKVVVKRNDGLTTSSYGINITRPLPTKPIINSPDILLCNPQTINATASNATEFYWTTTGGISASSPGNTSSAYVTGTADGTVSVTAYSSVCQVTSASSYVINVKRSAPYPAALVVYNNVGGSPDFMCRGYGLQLTAYTDEPGTNFSPWTTSNPGNTYLSYSGGQAYFNSYINDCYGIDVTASNCFGSVQKGITICVDDCSWRSSSNYVVYPNPAKDVINVSLSETENNSFSPDKISLFAENSKNSVKSIASNKEKPKGGFSINVTDLPRGIYYLHLTNKEGLNEKVRVMLE